LAKANVIFCHSQRERRRREQSPIADRPSKRLDEGSGTNTTAEPVLKVILSVPDPVDQLVEEITPSVIPRLAQLSLKRSPELEVVGGAPIRSADTETIPLLAIITVGSGPPSRAVNPTTPVEKPLIVGVAPEKTGGVAPDPRRRIEEAAEPFNWATVPSEIVPSGVSPLTLTLPEIRKITSVPSSIISTVRAPKDIAGTEANVTNRAFVFIFINQFRVFRATISPFTWS
jgi:hypothetical protein